MVFFFRSLVAQVFLNGYFMFRLHKNKRMAQWAKLAICIVLCAESVIYLTGFCARTILPFDCMVLIMKINAYWTTFSLYFFGMLSLFDLFAWLNKRYFHLKIKGYKLLLAEILAVALCFYAIGRNLQTGKNLYLPPQIKHLSFDLSASQADMVGKTTYRLLLVSDLHLGYLMNKTVMQQYVADINAQKADIILIDGDLIDYYLETLEIQSIDEELKLLSAPKGVYFVPGNHEYKRDADTAMEWIRQTGITVLRDSVATIDHCLQLIGRDDRRNEDDRLEWDSLLMQSDSSLVRIFVCHQPDDIEDGVKSHIPLILCGHTHGGQVFPLNLLNSLFFHNPYGLKREADGVYSYTTSGLGLSGFPVRIGSRSEMVIIEVKIENNFLHYYTTNLQPFFR